MRSVVYRKTDKSTVMSVVYRSVERQKSSDVCSLQGGWKNTGTMINVVYRTVKINIKFPTACRRRKRC